MLSNFVVVHHQRPVPPDQSEIQAVQLTPESLECVVTLRSGHVFVFAHSVESRLSSVAKEVDDAELVPLSHLPVKKKGGFQPSLLVDNSFGQVTVCEMSDIGSHYNSFIAFDLTKPLGFLAIAYTTDALIVVDMRGPRILLREATDFKSQKRRSSSLLHHGNSEANVHRSLRWVYCGFEDGKDGDLLLFRSDKTDFMTDSTPRIRLIASKASGATQVFNLSRASGSGSWSIDVNVGKLDGSEDPMRRGSFVIDSKTGASCEASQASLVSAMQSPTPPLSPSIGSSHCFWINVGVKGAKCVENLAGRRIGRVEWGKTRSLEIARVIYRSGE